MGRNSSGGGGGGVRVQVRGNFHILTSKKNPSNGGFKSPNPPPPLDPMCILFVCSEMCFYTFGYIDWVGWRFSTRRRWGCMAHKRATGNPQFLVRN